MNRFVPVLNRLKLSPDFVAPAAVLLQRAGWKDGAAASLVVADQRGRSYWQLRPWTNPDPPFDPTGQYPNSKDEEAAWRKAHVQMTSEAPASALRRALFRWCRGQLTLADPEDALLTPAVAAACAKASVDPKDPQGNAARIEALAAGMKLPVTPAEKATLVERLQSWEARPRQPKMVVQGGNSGLSISTSFVAPVAAYEPKRDDLDELAGLLDDPRPSRFWDFNGPRTVGDNAWRAMATVLKADPRKLAGYPFDHPWNTAERHAAAASVQAWWKLHKKEY